MNRHSVPQAILTMALLLNLSAIPASGQNATTTGVLTLAATFDCISVRAAFQGDANSNNTATLQFRESGASNWKNAYAPIVDRRPTVAGQVNPYVNQFRGSIVGLTAGTSYEVRLAVNDPDGMAATLSGTIATIAPAPPLSGRDWYVDASAVGGNGSANSPFTDVAAGISAASAGDRIHLRPGSYAAFTLAKSGTASAWISIVGDDRDTTIIRGGSVRNNITVDADYVQVANMRFQQSQHNSVEVLPSRHHVWLDQLYHENVSASQTYNDGGIDLNDGNHHIYVLNNTILAPGLTALAVTGARPDSPVNGIHVNGAMGAEGTFVFKGNTIIGGFRDCIGNSFEDFGGSTRDNTDIALNVISGCKDDAIQMEGDDINLRIWGNNITANYGWAAVATEASYVGPVYVFRNLIRMTWSGGGGAAAKIGGAVETFYFHNTIDSSGLGLAHDGFAGSPTTRGQVLRNNIIVTSGNPLYCMGNGGGNSSYDYNLYYRPSGDNIVSQWNCPGVGYATVSAFSSATGQEAHGRLGNPLFVDTDKHIGNTSPAFEGGVVLPNFNDAASAWPYAGSAPDIGAYELGGVITAPAPPTNVRIIR